MDYRTAVIIDKTSKAAFRTLLAGLTCHLAGVGMTAVKQEIPVINKRVFKTELVDTFHREKPKNIAVIDFFKTDNADIDFDMVSDVSHGFVVSNVIEKGLPNANIDKINIEPPESEHTTKQMYHNMDTTLTRIFNDAKQGKIYDAINISLGSELSFKNLNKQLGTNINQDNFKQKLKQLKKILHNKKDSVIKLDRPLDNKLQIGDLTKVIDKMDSISARGTKIYISAGNSKPTHLNLLTLGDNVNVVGALHNGEKESYSCDNSLVNKWAEGHVKIYQNKNGYSLGTDDKNADVTYKQTTGVLRIKNFFGIDGTSFAAPNAIVNDFK